LSPSPVPGATRPISPTRRLLATLAARRILGLVVLGFFLGGFVLGTAGEVLAAHLDVAGAGHLDDHGAPDVGDTDLPCAPDCACWCCPGRGVTAAFPVIEPELPALSAGKLVVSLPVALHPKNPTPRIFHPPRP